MSLVSFLALVGDIVTVGTALKNAVVKNSPEKKEIERYITFLEPRRVLYAQFDQEIKHAVIKSLEDIKYQTENLRTQISEKAIRALLGKLIAVISRELDNLWSYDTLDRRGQMKMFISIQKFRTETAKTLAILCKIYQIDPASTELKSFIVNMATVRPHTKIGN